MVALMDCIACAYGQYDSHIEDFAPAPEGVMGGARCLCSGDCAERYTPPPIVDAVARVLDPAAFDLLSGIGPESRP